MNRERLIDNFLLLAQISSLTGKEAAIIRRIRNKLKYFDLDIRTDNAGASFGGNCGNLIVTLEGNDNTCRPIALAAHVDTVDPYSRFKPRIENGLIRSDGKSVLGADDKAGVAIMIEMIESLKERKRSHGLIQMIFTVAEEKGLLGAKHMDYDLIRCEDIVVLDGDGEIGNMIIKAPAQNSIEVTVIGRAAHAGVCPEKGINAIHAIAKALADLDFGRIDSETTANVGTISGGVASNIVPAEVSIQAEVRSHNNKKLESYTDRIRKTVERYANASGAETQIEVHRAYEAFNLKKSSALVSDVINASARFGVKAKTVTSGGGSDANVFNAHGLHALNLSVGYEDVHTVNEFLDIDKFVRTAEIIEGLLAGAAR